MKVLTWNVNGIRARQHELADLLTRERPDIVCLQEIKASLDQLPVWICDLEGYSCYWHGGKGYSGVAMHVRTATFPDRPSFQHPSFDFEHRIVTAQLPTLTIASIYVPNGNKDFAAKIRFLEAMEEFAGAFAANRAPLVLCGDLNVARTERDIHPKERKPNQIGARAEERALIEKILSNGVVDVHRALDPDNDNLFTWWAPWRNLKQRNIGWRIDYVLASKALADRATSAVVQREIGSSDHGPVVVQFDFS